MSGRPSHFKFLGDLESIDWLPEAKIHGRAMKQEDFHTTSDYRQARQVWILFRLEENSTWIEGQLHNASPSSFAPELSCEPAAGAEQIRRRISGRKGQFVASTLELFIGPPTSHRQEETRREFDELDNDFEWSPRMISRHEPVEPLELSETQAERRCRLIRSESTTLARGED
ncbi:hypothetical protein CLAIMM_14866 [Cladophialophora immunda]|nr:hypothetical protein CLAIMM_14866 [Cladophialophora immunda]